MLFPWKKTDELREILETAINVGIEGAKYDFKLTLNLTTKEEKMNFAKDISAIANTDATTLEGYGFIIIGAKRHDIVGGFEKLLQGNIDNYQASLVSILKDWIAPVPRLHVIPFDEGEKGQWGAIVIEPSQNQPHLFIAEYSGSPARGDWYVRVSDINQRARPEDFLRVLHKAVSSALSPVYSTLEDTNRRLALAEDKIPQFLEILSITAGRRDISKGEVYKAASEIVPTEVIRNLLREKQDQVEEILQAEASKIADQIASTEAFPWVMPSDATSARALLDDVIALSRSLIEQGTIIARYNKGSNYVSAYINTLEQIAIMPDTPVGFVQEKMVMQYMRLFPATLCFLSYCWSCIIFDRPDRLKACLAAKYQDQRGNLFPIVDLIRRSYQCIELFNLARECASYLSSELWFRDALLPMVSSHSRLVKPESYYELEFVLALAFASACKHPSMQWMQGMRAIGGLFLYHWSAKQALENFIKRRADFLEKVFGEELSVLLNVFDKTAIKAIDSNLGHGDGFIRGAFDTYQSTK